MKLINFHCHLEDSTNFQKVIDFENHIFINNISSLNPPPFPQKTERSSKLRWGGQIEPNSELQTPNSILYSAGPHPLYLENSIPESIVIELLNQNKLFAIGEIGLDKRVKNFEEQKKVFIRFLEIAQQYQKPVIIHCVGYYYEILSIIKKNFPDLLYILHSFQGSVEIVKAFRELNIIFSLHKNILKKRNSAKILSEIINNQHFGFETDVDDDDFHIVLPTIETIAAFLNIDVNELFKNQYEAFKKIVSTNDVNINFEL